MRRSEQTAGEVSDRVADIAEGSTVVVQLQILVYMDADFWTKTAVNRETGKNTGSHEQRVAFLRTNGRKHEYGLY